MSVQLCAAIAASSLFVAPQDAPSVPAPTPGTQSLFAGSSPVGTSAASAPATVLLTNLPGAPGAMVPGLGSVPFEPGTGTNHFDRVYGHPSGHWVLTCNADLPASNNECLIVDGQLAIQEGEPAPWTAGENCGTIDQRCAVNAAGEFVFATNTSGSLNDDHVAGFIGGAWVSLAREGGPVPGLAGATLDDAIDSPLLLDDGRVGYAADGIDGVLGTDQDDVLVFAGDVVMQEGVTFPGGQAGAARAVENFDLGDYFASADGAHWIAQGDLEGATSSDDVVMVDGAVVVQEGQVIPGSGFAEPVDSSGIFGVSMDAGGSWYARGDNDGTNDDWVLRDGLVIATTGQPVTPGATERWDDGRFSNGFFAHAGNGVGNVVIGGTTDAADPMADAVLVLDGMAVVAREGDPVDVDGNGVFDDGVFIDTFGDDDLVLQDDLTILAVVTLRDAAGQRLGQGLISIDAGSGQIGTEFCDAVANSTGLTGRLRGTGSTSLGGNALALEAVNLPPGTFAIMMVGTARDAMPAFAGGLGLGCAGGRFGAYRRPGEVLTVSAGGTLGFSVDLTAIRAGGADVPAVPGETLVFQVLHRDGASAGLRTSNTTTAVEVMVTP